MRTSGIARAGEARRFRRHGGSCIGVGIVAGEQGLAAALPRHAHVGGEIVRRGASDTTLGHTTIAVAIKDAAFVIDGDLIKVEQVAVGVASALLPNTTHALDRIVRCCVYRGPSLATVVSSGDERDTICRGS